MTTATVPDSPQRFRWLVTSEFTKLRTLRSNGVGLLLTIVGTIGVAALVCAETAAHWKFMNPIDRANTDPTNLTLNGWYLTQLVVGVIAVLTVTSEFGSGMIRSTFAAAPRRSSVIAAKLLVVTTIVLLVSIACSVVSFLLGERLLHSTGIATTLGAPGVARAVFGSGLYVTAIALLGLGLGALIRNTAGAISALFGVLFVPPILAEAFPSSWHNAIQNYSPLNAGSQILNVHPGKGLGPWSGLGVLAVYVAVVLVAGFATTQTRDT